MNQVFAKIAGCAVALGTLVSAAHAETTLRFSNWLPVSHPVIRDIVIPWGEQVAEATDGRVTLDILDAPLGPPPAHYDLVATGAADVAFSVHAYTPGRFVLTSLPELPFLTTSSEASSVAYWRLHEAMLAEHNEHEGVKVLSVFVHGPGHLFTTERAVTPAAELQGAKIRVPGAIANTLAVEMGMVPIQAPSSQAYEVLSNGVADGILFPSESIPFFRLDSVVTNALRVPGGMYNVSFFIVMNEDTWNELSDEDKAAIESVSGEALARMAGQAWDAADAAGNEALEGVVTFTDASPEDVEAFTAAADVIYSDLREKVEAKGVDFDAAVTMLQEESAKVAAE